MKFDPQYQPWYEKGPFKQVWIIINTKNHSDCLGIYSDKAQAQKQLEANYIVSPCAAFIDHDGFVYLLDWKIHGFENPIKYKLNVLRDVYRKEIMDKMKLKLNSKNNNK